MLENIDAALQSANIAEMLDEEKLTEIGTKLSELVESDDESRSGWLDQNDEWLKLATHVLEEKSFPWPGASNVKYPLLSTAAIQFNARAYSALIKEPNPVKISVIGYDPDGRKAARSRRVSQYMSFQLQHDIMDWQDEMDRMLMALPILGLVHKKTYFSVHHNKVISEVVLPNDLIINYHATNFETARKTHRMYYTQNDVTEAMRMGHFLEIELTPPDDAEKTSDVSKDEILELSPSSNLEDIPYELMECHCFWDLDEDGYSEPYVITYDRDTRKVLRIAARFSARGVAKDESGRIIKIEPIEYFTSYKFLPDTNSKIYALGFGALLGPNNEAVNTILNQLVDAGTLSNLQGGFLGRGARLKGGTHRFKPGEWKNVQATGDDLRKSIYPLPVKEPSNVLFQLLGLLIEASERVSAVSNIMVGESPGQNQPYSTTAAVLEQGLKVFTAIYKRLYRALTQEFRKVFAINSLYFDLDKYINVLDVLPLTPEQIEEIKAAIQQGQQPQLPANAVPLEALVADFNMEDYDIRPTADPNEVTQIQKMMRAQGLVEKLLAGLPLNPLEVTRRIIEAEDHENPQALIQMEQKPDPQLELEMMKLELEKFGKETERMQAEIEASKAEFENTLKEAQALKAIAEAEAAETGSNLEMYKVELDAMLGEEKNEIDRIKAEKPELKPASGGKSNNA